MATAGIPGPLASIAFLLSALARSFLAGPTLVCTLAFRLVAPPSLLSFLAFGFVGPPFLFSPSPSFLRSRSLVRFMLSRVFALLVPAFRLAARALIGVAALRT